MTFRGSWEGISCDGSGFGNVVRSWTLYVLLVVDVLAIWAVSHEDGECSPFLGPVHVGTYDSLNTLGLDGNVLLIYIRERVLVHHMEVLSDPVWHAAWDNRGLVFQMMGKVSV
jgi:hypothetical protein